VTYTCSCRISALNNAHNAEKAHCSDVNLKPEGQPAFPRDGDEGIRTTEPEGAKFRESTAHFSSLLYQSSAGIMH